jgi:hypothetical protein
MFPSQHAYACLGTPMHASTRLDTLACSHASARSGTPCHADFTGPLLDESIFNLEYLWTRHNAVDVRNLVIGLVLICVWKELQI